MDNSVIKFQNVSKSFYLLEDRTFKEFLPSLFLGKSLTKKISALEEISFDIKTGETVGIIGRNGAGKSTILKLIAKVTTPTKGQITINSKVAPLIELGAGFHQELTGYENIFLNAAILGMHKKEIESRIEDIISFSELEDFIHVPVKKYSTGMYMRLGFSIAIHTDAPILLIDEVLAVGDEPFQIKCIKKLKEIRSQTNRTIVFVSHNEKVVKDFCHRTILIDHGKVVADGETSKVFASYHHLLNT